MASASVVYCGSEPSSPFCVRSASPATSVPVAGSRMEMWPGVCPGVVMIRARRRADPIARLYQSLPVESGQVTAAL